jgi:hypothetical protein
MAKEAKAREQKLSLADQFIKICEQDFEISITCLHLLRSSQQLPHPAC